MLATPGRGWAEASGLTGEPWYGPNYTDSMGYGPEMVVARRYAKERYPNVAVIKHAIGGTRLNTSFPGGPANWQVDGVSPDGDLRREMIANTQARLDEILANGDTYQIVACFWYQGESNTGDPLQDRAGAMRDLIRTMRVDLKERFAWINITVALFRPFVTAADEEVSRMFAVAQVSSSGLPTFTDNIHLWEDAQITLGNRCFDVLETM